MIGCAPSPHLLPCQRRAEESEATPKPHALALAFAAALIQSVIATSISFLLLPTSWVLAAFVPAGVRAVPLPRLAPLPRALPRNPPPVRPDRRGCVPLLWARR